MSRIMYIEFKGGNLTGEARIGRVTFSKTKKSIHYNGKTFKSLKGGGFKSNYFDSETGEEYWISGVKKNNQDSHWAGGGDILIDSSAVKLYLKETGFASLPSNLITATLAPSKQLSTHANLEHRSNEERPQEYLNTVPSGRSGAIKRKV